MKERLNARVKHREAFRPFAPSVLEEATGEVFASSHPSPFMAHVYPVRPEWQARIPAVTHVDGTGRLQTVSAATHPRYHRLIAAFRDRTGVPVVLNTSFNDDEPIVHRPGGGRRLLPAHGHGPPRARALGTRRRRGGDVVKKAFITGITGQDGSLPRRAPARQGLRGPRADPPRLVVPHGADRPPLRRPARRRLAAPPPLRRHARRLDAAPPPRGDPPAGGLQPRRPEPRARVLRHARVHGRGGRDGHAARARGDPRRRREGHPLLPGGFERDVRRGPPTRRTRARPSTRAAPTPARRSSPTTRP